jgi:hypothetical protein
MQINCGKEAMGCFERGWNRGSEGLNFRSGIPLFPALLADIAMHSA